MEESLHYLFVPKQNNENPAEKNRNTDGLIKHNKKPQPTNHKINKKQAEVQVNMFRCVDGRQLSMVRRIGNNIFLLRTKLRIL